MNTTVRGARIAHLIESDGPGGAERVLVQLATSFAEAGCECLAVVPAHGEGWVARELAATRVAVAPVRLDGPVSTRCVRDLTSLFRQHRIDMVHSHEFTMAVYGTWAARRSGLPHVITMHGGRYYATGPHRRLALRMAVRASGGAVAVSDTVGRQLRSDLRLSARLVSVIPNGVRPEAPGPATLRRELDLGPADLLIVAVGNLYPVKGHAHLIAGFAAIADEFPTAHLAIAGRGALRDALNECAAAHHVADRVHLLGLRADVGGVLASADLFAMPSLAEGMPLSLLEAMFRGLPVVATDVGEVRQMLAGGAGVVVEPANAAQLATAMRDVLRDPSRARCMGEAARRRATSEFDLQRTVDRYADLYARYLLRDADG